MTLGRKLLRSAKIDVKDDYARTLGSVSFALPTRNEGSGVGTRGACAEPLGHKRERWWVIEMTITSSINTFSNSGNIPTLHQPTVVTVTTVTLTGFPQWLIHITCLKFLWFRLAGSTHTTYCKTLQNALGMKTVNARVFEKIYLWVCIIYDLCEVAKREMKEKNDGDLGSWKRAVTTADGTWQTRGWHSNLCRGKSFLEGSTINHSAYNQ